jgi:hypothetical protein
MFKPWLNKSFALFCILGFLFIPLTFDGLDFQYQLTRFLFLQPVSWIQNHFFSEAIKNIDFSSDTIGLNILLCLLLAIACIVIALLDLFKIKSYKVIPLFRFLAAYYIAFILLKYGVDKIVKRQFYLPEPNILYANFGSLTRDTLFWSTFGTSRSYSLITGGMEVVTAILILVKRTRIAGLFLSVLILANILLINFSFDISVKTFAAFLLLVSVCMVYPYLKSCYAFFIQRKQAQLLSLQLPVTRLSNRINILLSAVLVCYVLYPYIRAGNFNDDKAERPFLHGAYGVTRFIIAGDTLHSGDFPYKRFFIHRNSYIIFQQKDDTMTDYFFEIDSIQKQLTLQDYDKNTVMVTYAYTEKTGALQLKFNNREKWIIESDALNWKALPALQGGTHYTVDEIK